MWSHVLPYIIPEDRIKLPRNPGSLNYHITRLCHDYIKANGGVSYTNLNAVVGVLECAKLEVYRQLAAPYEDEKKAVNGAISELDS